MAVIADIVSTRMELMKLKKKEIISVKGHKLLKDKLDELIRILITNIRQWKALDREIASQLQEIRASINLCSVFSDLKYLRQSLFYVKEMAGISVTDIRVLNIDIKKYELNPVKHELPFYGTASTSSFCEGLAKITEETVRNMLKLSELERSMNLISDEVLRTRRRVNALEYYMIPNIRDTIKSISMKLEEHDRNTKSQLMRIKDLIRAPKVRSSANPGGFKIQDL